MENSFPTMNTIPLPNGSCGLNGNGFSVDCTNFMSCLEIIKQGNGGDIFQNANNEIQRITHLPSFPMIFMYDLSIFIYI